MEKQPSRALGVGGGVVRPCLLPERIIPIVGYRFPCWRAEGEGISSLFAKHRQQRNTATDRAPLFSEVCHSQNDVQLSSTHRVGTTLVETMIQGNRVHLSEFRLRLLKSLFSLQNNDNVRLCQNGQLALSFITDIQHHHRLTLEGTMGIGEDSHILSSVISSDFVSLLTWGLATSHRLRKQLTLFSRYSSDQYTGKQLIFQTVHELDAKNTVATIYAATVGRPAQAGVSWLHRFFLKEGSKESLQFKVLYSGDGTYSVSVNAQVGAVDG